MLEQLLALSVEKKIGQLFFIGIGGDALAGESEALVEEIAPGGVCLFARNIKNADQTRKLLADIRVKSTIEPFLSLDEEGGIVDRLRRITTPLPAASSIKNTADARELADVTSEILLTLGFNMNFAPVVDVVDESRAKFNNGLYSRAFGSSKEEVAQLAGAYLAALQNKKILGCLKHFPGLGASSVDSHEELPLVNLSESEFETIDLYPYREIFKTEAVAAVMIAHAAYPQIESQNDGAEGKLLPSSLNYNFVTALLRGRLDFDGIAITDDLEMGAIVKTFGFGEACRLALKAGNDMLAVCAEPQNIRAGFKAVCDAVKTGEISEERIDESLRRIARVKNLLTEQPDFSPERLPQLSERIALLKERLES